MSVTLVTPTSTSRSFQSAVSAGDRRVWGWASVVGLLLSVLVLAWCLVPRAYYPGTDSVTALTSSPPVPALAVWVIGALHAAGRQRMIAVGAMLLAALLAMNYASQLLMFTAFYAA